MDINDKKRIGKEIRNCRETRGLSREALADKLGLSKYTIIKYEQGQRTPDPQTLIQIANTLEVGVWVLLGVTKEDAYSSSTAYEAFGNFYEEKTKQNHKDLIAQILEMDKYKGKFSTIINRRMEMLNMSLDELSIIMQIPISKLNNNHYFDNPNITLDELTSLSKALDVSLEYLAGNECIDLPSSYYKNILGLVEECGAKIDFNKNLNSFDISYENTKLSTDYNDIKKLKDDILTFTKFKISEMFK